MFNFGKGGVYPSGSGPYVGNPIQVNPNYKYFTPGAAFAPSAQEMNYIMSSIEDAAGAGLAAPGCSWRTQMVPTPMGYGAFSGGQYDPILRQWLLLACVNTGAGASELFGSQGFGDVDYSTALSSGGGFTVAGGGAGRDVVYDGSHYFMAHIQNGGALSIARCSPGGAWASVYNDVTQTYTDCHIRIFGGNIVVYGIHGVGMGSISSAVGGGAGGSWTALIGVTQPGTNIYSATNGTVVVNFPGTAAPTNYQTTTAPTVGWTLRSAAFLVHSDVPEGLTYSVADGVFVLITFGAADNKIHTYNSTDGVVWSEVGTPFASTGVVNGLASTAGGCLASLWFDPLLAAGQTRLIYSIDAGFTWHPSTMVLPTIGFTAITQRKVIASPTGFWAMNNGFARFSHASGLSPVLV